MQVLRALVPSWRFFDTPAAALALEARRGDDGPWLRLPCAAPRRWYAPLWNPAGSLALASHGALEQLVHTLAERFDLDAGVLDLDDAPAELRAEVEALPAFRLAARQVAARHPDARAWRVVMLAADAPDGVEELLRARAAP